MLAKIGRILIRIIAGVLLFLIVLLLVFDRLGQFRMNDKDLSDWFHARHVEAHIAYYTARGRTVRYVRTGDSPEATILFIHGAPSSLSYWKAYLSDISACRESRSSSSASLRLVISWKEPYTFATFPFST